MNGDARADRYPVRMARPRYELRDPELDGALEDLVARVCGEREGSEYLRQILVSAVQLVRDDAATGDLKMINSTIKELRHSFRVFAPFKHLRKVAVFGSARTDPEHPDWQQAFAFAEKLVAGPEAAVTFTPVPKGVHVPVVVVVVEMVRPMIMICQTCHLLVVLIHRRNCWMVNHPRSQFPNQGDCHDRMII